MPDVNSKYINEITADPALAAAIQAFLPAVNTNRVALGMTTQQVTDLTTACNAYLTGVTAVVTAKNAVKSAVTQKDDVKSTARTAISTWAKTWRANPTIPDSLLATVQTAPHNPESTSTPPSTPTNLVATANGLGAVKLKWKKGANKVATQYLIEMRTSPTDEWTIAGLSPRLKFEFQAAPGQYIAFRVIAARASQLSAATAPVILWDNGSSASLSIAA